MSTIASAQEFTHRLKALSEANRSLSQLVSRLSKLSTPTAAASTPATNRSGTTTPAPGDDGASSASSTGAATPTAARLELGAEIHHGLKELEEDFELVRQEAEDYTSQGTGHGFGGRRSDGDRERDRLAVSTQVEKLGEDLKLTRAQFRRAQLQAKRNEEIAKRKERDQLFAGVQDGSNGIGNGNGNQTAGYGRRKGNADKLTQDELVVGAATDVTAALRRTHQLMQGELQRSQFAQETLQQSTEALRSLNESYGTLDDLLSSSKSLITTLVSSQKSDTWYLETALYILLVTIGWLVFRRIFWGPVKYLVLLPTKWTIQFFFSIFNVFIGLFAGRAATAASAGSSLSSSSASLSSAISTSVTVTATPIASAYEQSYATGMSSGAASGGGSRSAGGADGSAGQKERDNPDSLLEQVGDMAEETLQQEQDQRQHSGQQRPGSIDAGSNEGTVLRERREDEQANPKKRMFEEPEGERDEL